MGVSEWIHVHRRTLWSYALMIEDRQFETAFMHWDMQCMYMFVCGAHLFAFMSNSIQILMRMLGGEPRDTIWLLVATVLWAVPGVMFLVWRGKGRDLVGRNSFLWYYYSAFGLGLWSARIAMDLVHEEPGTQTWNLGVQPPIPSKSYPLNPYLLSNP